MKKAELLVALEEADRLHRDTLKVACETAKDKQQEQNMVTLANLAHSSCVRMLLLSLTSDKT